MTIKLSRLATCVLVFLILIFLFAYKVSAQVILFSDDFNDGDANGWQEIGSPGWSVQNGEYGILLSPGLSNAVPSDSVWQYSWTNIEYKVDLRETHGVDKNILLKFKDTSNFIEIHGNDRGIFLEKASTIGGNGILAFSDRILDNNIIYHFKIKIINNSRIKVYLDDNLLFDVGETAPLFTNWKIGLRAGTGGSSSTEVWFDNVAVTSLEPTPSPTPTPTPTPIPTIGPFELPFNYPQRLNNNPLSFKNAFWNTLTAAFDHVMSEGIFRPFTGSTYSQKDCPTGRLGITCYDSHNGTDFSTFGGQEVFSVGSGRVAYTSEHTNTSCTPNKGGYGCVVIVEYPRNNFGLYAHLDRIFVNTDQQVEPSTLIGEMGATGCPNCGEHLHFGIMQSISTINSVTKRMSRKDWKELLYKIKPDQSPRYRPACTYTAPNGIAFAFRDPSGWKGNDIDPWGKPKIKGGCGITSPYLWRFEVGITP